MTGHRSRVLVIGLAACEIQSWLTGRRLVSMPFADHCQPLFADQGDCAAVVHALEEEVGRGRWKYIEVRPLARGFDAAPDLVQSATFCFHWIAALPGDRAGCRRRGRRELPVGANRAVRA